MTSNTSIPGFGLSLSQGTHNKEKRTMPKEIEWKRDFNTSLALAKKENRPVLLFFHNPE
jgi:hypothetical protein